MSIVERALRRLQQSSPKDLAPQPARAAVRSPRRSEAREQADLPSSERSQVRPPKESVEGALELLRASGVLPVDEHARVTADQFRRIKWPVLDSAAGKGEVQGRYSNVVMVTSSVAGEGKTFTTVNLALSIARERDVSVLLVDADVAKAHVTRTLKAENQPGLTEVLAGTIGDPQDVVLGTGIPGLTFLPAGRRTESLPELFASHRMAEVVQALGSADRSRIVLFDSSPLLATNESQVLGRIVDQIVFVVRAESTTQPMVLEALGLLDNSKEIRCVLNQSHASELSEYYYGYGSYHPNEPPQQQ